MLLLEWLVSQSSFVLDAIIPPPPPAIPSFNRLLEWLLEPNALEWLVSQSSPPHFNRPESRGFLNRMVS